MELFEKAIVYIIMACAVCGVIASIVNKDHPLGKKFFEGLDTIGTVFLPVVAILVSAPFIDGMITQFFGPIYEAIGSDVALAATTIIATDMGGYELAAAIAATKESWIMAMIVGYMGGATIVFSIPVALRILHYEDRKYLALGTISGFMAIPVGVFFSCVFIALSQPAIREFVGKNLNATYQLSFSFALILKNLLPLIIISVLLLILLKWKPKALIKGFLIFGNIMDFTLRIIFVLAMIEYSTGLFSEVFGYWGFDPIMADQTNLYRAAEAACSIGIMLAGAFPFVYILQTYLKKPLALIGRSFHLSVRAMAGILAASANVIALLGIVRDLTPEDKIKCIAYSVCAAFLIGDHLLFTDLYQPSLALPIMIGKLIGGCFGIFLAAKIAVPVAKTLAKEELIKEGSSIQK
ncbi:MAG TPA: ethanolamine utilization protein EutH [Clostridiales bacterium]|nr:ethanolamine utilization protein EutH [Clostridiales bacterium]